MGFRHADVLDLLERPARVRSHAGAGLKGTTCWYSMDGVKRFSEMSFVYRGGQQSTETILARSGEGRSATEVVDALAKDPGSSSKRKSALACSSSPGVTMAAGSREAGSGRMVRQPASQARREQRDARDHLVPQRQVRPARAESKRATSTALGERSGGT